MTTPQPGPAVGGGQIAARALADAVLPRAVERLGWAEDALRLAVRRLNDAIDAAHAAGMAPAAAADLVTSAGTLGVLGRRYLDREVAGWDDIYETGPRPGGPADLELLDLHARPRPGASRFGPGSEMHAPGQLAETGARLAEAEVAFAEAIGRFDDAADFAQCAAVSQSEAQALVWAGVQALGAIGREYVSEEVDGWFAGPPHDLADQFADGTEPAAFWEAAWQARTAKGSGDYEAAALAWVQARDVLPAGHPLRASLDGMITSLRTAAGTGQHVTWDGRLLAADFAGVTAAPAAGDAATEDGVSASRTPAPLDAPAGALIAALRAAPEGDVLWSKEGDAWWIARRARMDVLLRAGDLLRIPDVDFYSQIALADEVTRAARGLAIAAAVDSAVELTADSSQSRGRRFEVTRVPQREGYGILSVLHENSGHVPDPFLLLIDGRRVGGTYWCAYNPAPSGFGRDDGGLPDESWASWGPRGLSCGHPTRKAAEQAQVDVYKTDPDGWDMRLAGGHAELTPERDRPDGARFWDHRTNRDFWSGYAATLARVRAERPSTVDGVAAILSCFQAPSAGIAFFGNNADDQLSDALADAGWQLQFLERDYLWEARHPGTGERLHCIEGDVYPGPYETAASANPSATTQSVQAERSIDYPAPVTPGAKAHAGARPAAANQASRPAARRTP
jgi:hypothetical protein